MKGTFKDFKFQFWASFINVPTLRGLFILIFSFLFSFFSAQDSLQTKISQKTNITVIGKAQIYSSDQSFNKLITDKKLKVIAAVNYKPYENTILITSAKKTKNLSAETKLSQKKIFPRIDKSVLSKLKKIEKNTAENESSFKNPVSENFFYSGNAQLVNFIVPDSQNHSQNSHVALFIEFTPVFILISENNNFYFNTRSKMFGYSKTYSLRPPPVLS